MKLLNYDKEEAWILVVSICVVNFLINSLCAVTTPNRSPALRILLKESKRITRPLVSNSKNVIGFLSMK